MSRMDTSRLAPDLARLNAQILDGVARGLARTAQFALAIAGATREFEDRTSRARASIRHGVRSRFAHFVAAGGREAPYVKFLEDGTKAHEIRPKLGGDFIGPARSGQGRGRGEAKPLLRFQIAGRWISKHVVKHPGTRPTHFMQDARDRAEIAAQRLFKAELSGAIQR